MRRAEVFGCDYVATGHYARRGVDAAGRPTLLRATDPSKDQSYVLWGLAPSILEKAIFPIGHLRKEEVRARARDLELAVADKRESQDICFVEGKRYLDFLRERFPERLAASPRGAVKDSSGRAWREHDGIHAFTVGQRRGIDVSASIPLYVTRIDAASGTVEVGPEQALYHHEARVTRVSYPTPAPPPAEGCEAGPIRGAAKIRYAHPAAAATWIPGPFGEALVRFDEPQRALTPGQSLVLYDGDRVVAGGVIAAVEGS